MRNVRKSPFHKGFEPFATALTRYTEGTKTAPRRCANTVDPRGLADYQGVD